MQSHQPLGPGELRGERLQRQTRRIGGEPGGGLHARLETCIQRTLRIEVFKDRLDDDIGPQQRPRRPDPH
jgi:hypothetical protein